MAQTLWEALPFIRMAKGPIMSKQVSLKGDCRFVPIGCNGAIIIISPIQEPAADSNESFCIDEWLKSFS